MIEIESKKKNLAERQFCEVQSVSGLTTNNNTNKQDYNTPAFDTLQEELQNKFAPKKCWSEVLACAYRMIDLEKRADRVFNCGSLLEFKVSEQSAKLNKANFCKDRLCPMCNWRRSLKIFGQVSKIMNAEPMADFEYLFLTLTVKNCTADELPNTIDKLFEGWRYFYNKNSIFKRAVKGTFRTLEITKNKQNGSYHPHIHCILAVNKSYFKSREYISQKEWTELWKKACGLDYKPIVHIEKVKDSGKGIAGAVVEVSKYAVKGSDILYINDMDKTAETVQDFLKALTGRRLCAFTGVFAETRKQLKLDDIETGNLVHTDIEEDLRDDIACMIVCYQWRAGAYYKAK